MKVNYTSRYGVTTASTIFENDEGDRILVWGSGWTRRSALRRLESRIEEVSNR